MKPETRIWLAYVAGRLMLKRRYAQIFDMQIHRYFFFKGRVSQSGIYLHDLTRNCFITGDGKKGDLRLYDQGTRSHTHLKVEVAAKEFSGYDHTTMTHYVGKFDENMVKLFDYRDNCYYKFHF